MPLRAVVRILAALLVLAMAAPAGAKDESRGSVETQTRFLEYDALSGRLAYEVTVRNLGQLPVSFVELRSDPACQEGPFMVDDLGRGQSASRVFSFAMGREQQILHPRFELAFTDYEGERLRVLPQESLVAASVDFSYCDVATGWTDMAFSLTNTSPEPLLFLELRSENPSLSTGKLEAESLGPGKTVTWTLEYQLEPGETVFNPTLHLDYHQFGPTGTDQRRSFFTFLQPDLRRVEKALMEKAAREQSRP